MSLEELDELFKKAKPYIVFYGKMAGHAFCTDDKTLRAWNMIMTIPRIEFPEAESHRHYKWRMLVKRLKELPSLIRWKIFPYHIIHKDDYEWMFEE